MWDQFDGRPYTRDAFRAHVAALPDEAISWVRFICLHNTAAPNIGQWNSGPSPTTRIVNLQHYYEVTKGWHSGPHGFIPPHPEICIYGFTPFTERGVHASCFNKLAWGLEMVGDFDADSFDDGPGRLVHENAVFVLAVLHARLRLRPDGFELGKAGLHFHVDCARDNHACPGRHVKREVLVPEVLFAMHELENPTPAHQAQVAIVKTETASIPVSSSPAPPPATPPPSLAPAIPKSPAEKMEEATKPPASWIPVAKQIDELAQLGSRIAASLRDGGNALRALLLTLFAAGSGAATVPHDGPLPHAISQSVGSPFHAIVYTALATALIMGGIGLWYIHRASRGLISAKADARYTPPLEAK